MILDCPNDVILAVLQCSDGRGIVNFGLTCKAAHEITQQRSVWLHALQDILSLTPHPALAHSLPSLPSADLKRQVLRNVHLDDVWQKVSLHAMKLTSFEIYGRHERIFTQNIVIFPGGEWMVEAHLNCKLRLYRIHPDGTPEISSEIKLGPRFKSLMLDSNIALSSKQEPLLIVSLRGEVFAYHVYRVDVLTATPAFELVTEIIASRRDSEISNITVSGNFLAYMDTKHNEDRFLVVRTLVPHGTRHAGRVSVNPPCSSHIHAVRILSEHRLLLVDYDGVYAVGIPPLREIPDVSDEWFNKSSPVTLFPFTRLYTHSDPSMASFTTSPIIWSGPGMYHRPLILHQTFSPILHIVELGPDDTPRHTIVRLPPKLHRMCAHLGARHSIFRRIPYPSSKLSFCAFPVEVGGSRALELENWRVSEIEMPPGQLRKGQDICLATHDEASGRICLLVAGGMEPPHILVVDVTSMSPRCTSDVS